MRLLRLYLLFCGVLFNLGLALTLGIELTASEPLMRPGFERLLYKVAADHPRFARMLAPVVPAAVILQPPPAEAPFSPVPPAITTPSPPAGGRILRVGPGRHFTTPEQAAADAKKGDTVLIEPGRYAGGTAVWRADGLLIKGDGGMATMDAKGAGLPQNKAIWVIQGNNARVENIEFTGAVSSDGNGAGIRAEGRNLHVVNCFFHHNQEGILSNPDPESEILIEHSEFAWNGHPNGQAHNVYISDARRLIFRFNYVHHAIIGSNLKSRARENRILYNRIMDYADGRVNYSIDLSNGGMAYVIGNIIEQGPLTENYHLLSFAPEGARYPRQELYVVHNTFVNDRGSSQFIRNNSRTTAYVYNNLFIGPGGLVKGAAILAGNVIERKKGLIARRFGSTGGDGFSGLDEQNRIVNDAGVRGRESYDYHLKSDSPAIEAGLPLEKVNGFDLTPHWQYLHPRQGIHRRDAGMPDAGAYGD